MYRRGLGQEKADIKKYIVASVYDSFLHVGPLWRKFRQSIVRNMRHSVEIKNYQALHSWGMYNQLSLGSRFHE